NREQIEIYVLKEVTNTLRIRCELLTRLTVFAQALYRLSLCKCIVSALLLRRYFGLSASQFFFASCMPNQGGKTINGLVALFQQLPQYLRFPLPNAYRDFG